MRYRVPELEKYDPLYNGEFFVYIDDNELTEVEKLRAENAKLKKDIEHIRLQLKISQEMFLHATKK